MPKEEGMSRRQLRREQIRRSEKRQRTLFIVGIVLVAVAVVAFVVSQQMAPIGSIATPAATIDRPQVSDNGTGDPNAPIKIEEFSDFQCPYCKRFSDETEAQLISNFVATGKVYFVYRSFGEFIGPNSRAAAEAAYCAGDQNKFWEMHDMLFANHTGENVGDFTDKRLTAFAEMLKLDMTKYQACVSANTYDTRINQDATDGTAAGIKATPSFVMTYTVGGQIKTVLIEGAVPLSDFQTKIDAAMAEMGK